MTKLIGGPAFACLVVLVVAATALATASSGFSRAQTDAPGSSTATGVRGPRWVVTDIRNLGWTRVEVADINDRGLVVGTGHPRAAGRGFVWRDGAMQELGRGRFGGAQAINERGQIIGTSSSAATADQHAVLWENGRMIDLRPRGGVTAINERGQILGFRYVSINDPRICTGQCTGSTSVIWQNGKMRDLGLSASAINNRGQVVGAIYDGTAGRAVMWQNGTISDLGPGQAMDINERGQIVGRRDEHVVVWQNGAAIDVGPGWPVAINERGQVTGFTLTPTGVGHAFLWRNGTTTDLGTLGGAWSIATAISNRGQVVGYSLDRGGEQHAFLWQNGTMIKLGSPKGKTGPYAFRTRAIAINENNQIIGDNCLQDCGLRRGSARSRFAVIWTLRR